MRLNWFSPLPPARSGVSEVTEHVAPVLGGCVELTLWTDQAEWDPGLERHARVRSYRRDRIPWRELNGDGVSVYHLGNNPAFHAAIWEASRRHPGIVVLHDHRLHHFFEALYVVQRQDLEGFLRLMERAYGPEGRKAVGRSFLGRVHDLEHLAERYPLTALAVEGALAVVVHSRQAFEALEREGRWPVLLAQLPYPAGAPGPGSSEPAGAGETGGSPGPYRIVVFGHIGANRRLEALLEALAGLPERESFRLCVYGEVLEEERIRARIRSLGLQALVALHGYVAEPVLDEALARADLAVNLRYPSMGEASISQLRIWSHALPALVTRVGWYAELPPESVAFVDPEREVADVRGHLASFLRDPAAFRAKGRRGRRELEERHSPEAYADALLELASRAPEHRGRALAWKLSARAGAALAGWLDPGAAPGTARRLAAEVLALSGRAEPSPEAERR